MVNFESLIRKLDKGNILGSINALPLQCQEAWKAVKRIKLPSSYKKIDNIIACGMGGSSLGTDFLRYVFYTGIKRPLTIVNDYKLPEYFSSRSLVFISSYSGNTEESLSCLREVLKRKSKIVIITSDGQLAKLAKSKKIPVYIFDPIFNPSSQPRMGLGYSIMAQLAIFKNLNLVEVKEKMIKKALTGLDRDKSIEKKAQKLAIKLYKKIPLIVAAEFLSGNAHILANQINENAKTFSTYFLLPEMNHHLVEGLSFPKVNKDLIFLFLESDNYSPVIKKRITITKQILNKKRISYLSCITRSKGKLSESFEILLVGSYLSFYLSLLNNIDPSKIPTVDYLKKSLLC